MKSKRWNTLRGAADALAEQLEEAARLVRLAGDRATNEEACLEMIDNEWVGYLNMSPCLRFGANGWLGNILYPERRKDEKKRLERRRIQELLRPKDPDPNVEM